MKRKDCPAVKRRPLRVAKSAVAHKGDAIASGAPALCEITPAARADLARLMAQILYDRYIAAHPAITEAPSTVIATLWKPAQNPGDMNVNRPRR